MSSSISICPVLINPNEGREPMHVHGFAKFWMEPVELEFSQGLKVQDIKQAQDLIVENYDLIKDKWHEVHGS